MNPLQGLFQDDNDGASAARFVFVFGSAIVILVWAILSIKNGSMEGLGTILGVLAATKVGNKVFEVQEAIGVKKDAGTS